MSSQVKYSLQAFWGVSIRELHVSLWRTWNDLRDASNSHIVDSSYCQQLATNVRSDFTAPLYGDIISPFRVRDDLLSGFCGHLCCH